ncbi:M48 family metallopeptidase [Glutamicibacter sp. NPDC087344]|uniref:M48 metallopeptidase family protein n=1 Tax=Glutamicibacter sp. NPDC087344 TaxID=3363994 RepID=UPI00381D9686
MPVSPQTVDFLAPDDIPVRIVRSAKRRKTISSQWRDDRLVVQVPAALDERSERMLVQEMIKKFRQNRVRRSESTSEENLASRAAELDQRYFGGKAQPVSVRWVGNQNKRWGSASVYQKTIRLSSRLKHTPQWVQDYVLVHELAHLLVPKDGHGAKFQDLLNRFERRVEADQYLAGFSAGFRAHAAENGQESLDAGGFDGDEDS